MHGHDLFTTDTRGYPRISYDHGQDLFTTDDTGPACRQAGYTDVVTATATACSPRKARKTRKVIGNGDNGCFATEGAEVRQRLFSPRKARKARTINGNGDNGE